MGRSALIYLVDTHVFPWANVQPNKLTAPIADILASNPADVILSAVSIYEIELKVALRKLAPLPASPLAICIETGIELLPV